ncbi:BED-type domain-containing protein [Citrus sinensis]|nr:BED-type domain-containing protein [Citrus sinensis]
MRKLNIDGKVIAQCNHCKKTFDGSSKKGTTHLNNHLQRCPANPKRKSGSDGRDGDDRDQSLSPSIKTKELASLIKEKYVRGLIKHFSKMEGDTGDEEWEDFPDWQDLDPWVLNSRKDEILQLYQEEKEKLGQFLNTLSCRFTLRLVFRRLVSGNRGMDRVCLLEVHYIDDSWELQSKIISFWHCPRDRIKNLTEAVKQLYGLDDEIGKMESLFSQRRSLPFAGCLLNMDDLFQFVYSVLKFEDYMGDGIQSLKECAAYVQNKATSDKLIRLYLYSWSNSIPSLGDIPIIVDLPYVHKILKDRRNHTIEDCLFCQKVMKGAIDLFLSKHYSVRVIAVILDPRLKMDGVRLHYKEIYGRDADRYIEKVNKDFRDVYDAYAATDSSSSKSYEMLDATSSPKSELDLYMKELKVPAVQQFNILAWWRGNAPFYPTLARMARDYLALESPFDDEDGEDALFDLQCDIRDINKKFKFCDLPEIITPLLCLEGILVAIDNCRGGFKLRPEGTQPVDARFRFSSFYDQDLCSINFVTTRRSPRQASSPEVPAYTDKSEYAGCFPGANPPTLKSDMKASSESQSSALFETVWDSNCCVMGKTWDLACYATVQGKAWLPWLCETLRVTPRFWGKCGCHGSVRSCVLRHGSGESVAVMAL